MKQFVPYGEKDLSTFLRVLQAWSRSMPDFTEASGVTSHIRKSFNPIPTTELSQLIVRPLRRRVDLAGNCGGWIFGAPLEGKGGVYPVLTASYAIDENNIAATLALRVGLFSQSKGEDNAILAEGWRFESPEHDSAAARSPASPGRAIPSDAHPYAHAQAISGWTTEAPCLLHPSHRPAQPCTGVAQTDLEDHVYGERLRAHEARLVKHPAFPLAVTTATGLALAAHATLYSAPNTHELLKADRRLWALNDDDARGADLSTLGMFHLRPR